MQLDAGWWHGALRRIDTREYEGGMAFTTAVRERYQPISSPMIARQSLDSFVQRGSVQMYTDHFYQCINFITGMGRTDQIHRYTHSDRCC